MSSCDDTRVQGKDLITSHRRSADLASSQMRGYVGDMARELARMARGQGDEKLALILDVAADIARDPALKIAGKITG